MAQYRHRQFAWVLVGAMGIGCAIAVGAALGVREQSVAALATAGALALVAALFSSLEIEITDTELRWSFGPGLIQKRVALDEIADVQVTRTRWWEGWGIHFTSRGWLYNVAGFSAVAIRLRSGKRFVLGTDEPETLARHLARHLRKA